LENYSHFFEDISQKITKLDTKNPTKVGARIGKLKDMIAGVKNLSNITENANAKENLRIINERLDHMLLLVNVKRNYLISISKISDFSYAWIYIHDYKKEMQDLLRQDSKNVLLLRATFLKLASILNFPLVRLFEIDSDDIESVTDYYSGELVKYVKDILQVIPHRVFELMNKIYTIFCNQFKEMPNKILKKDLKEYSQIDERFQLAQACHGISMITKGILMMEKTLMGVIEVDPKVILEEGIRTELLKVLATAFHNHIDFGPGDKIDLKKKLNVLLTDLTALKKSFVYIQDYINLNGSKIWSEEMHRLINFYVELEANKFLSKKIKNTNDKYENLKYQIPSYPPLKNSPDCYTFLGRITRYILNLTDPKYITFCAFNSTWYEKDKLDKEVFSIKLLYKIKNALGIEGFQGLGRLLGYLNFQNLVKLQPFFTGKLFNENSIALGAINKQFGSPFVCTELNPNLENDLLNNIRKFNSKVTDEIMDRILKIGQIEYMRKIQNYILSENSVIDCSILNTEIKSMDIINLMAMKNEMKINFQNDDANQNPLDANQVKNKGNPDLEAYYNNLLSFLEDFGFIDTEHTFFQDLNSLQYLSVILAITTFTYIKKYYEFDNDKMTISKKMKQNFDIHYYTLGMYCILYQMGKKNIVTFISMVSEMLRYKLVKSKKKQPKLELKDIKKEINANVSGENNPEITKHIPLLLFVLHELRDNCDISMDYFDMNLNNYLMFKNVANYNKVEPPKNKK
jgi:WASH complex subunit strumpellin